MNGYSYTWYKESLKVKELKLIKQAVNSRKRRAQNLVKALANHHPGKHCILDYNLTHYEYPSSTPWKEKWAHMRQIRETINDDIELIRKLRTMIKERIIYDRHFLEDGLATA
jgi:uncharacterized protein YjaG (DUF416 family)